MWLGRELSSIDNDGRRIWVSVGGRSTELAASIRAWINNWNEDPKPFIWHKTADEILDSVAAYCQRINDSGH
jgi:hypothetical protein